MNEQRSYMPAPLAMDGGDGSGSVPLARALDLMVELR
jgi:hypothetical protein